MKRPSHNLRHVICVNLTYRILIRLDSSPKKSGKIPVLAVTTDPETQMAPVRYLVSKRKTMHSSQLHLFYVEHNDSEVEVYNTATGTTATATIALQCPLCVRSFQSQFSSS